MSFNLQDPNAIPDYLQAVIKLNELQKMTEDLDEELADSQQMMRDMKTLFNKMPHRQRAAEPVNEGQQEAFAQFLQAGPPQLLMEDMPANTTDIDLDNLIATMKVYTEELRKNLDLKPRVAAPVRSIDVMDLDGYATSLDQLVKRLANLKLQKPDDASSRNTELEAKLQQLCEDGNSFTKMVETMKRQREAQTPGQVVSTDPLVYDNLINKLLADINEVTYLLKNKN